MTHWSRPPVPARLVASAQAPFVGRRTELEILEEVWDSAARGVRQALFVGGEPGSGKTRLMAEVAMVVARHDATVLMGTSAADYGIPYQPFVEMLDQLLAAGEPGIFDQLPRDTVTELSRLVPLLVDQPLDDEPDEDVPARRIRLDLFDATADLFGFMARDHPLVLVLDDMQWAQAPTLALLGHITSKLVEARLLVLASFRSTAADRSEELTSAIADLYRLEGVRRIDLAGLDTNDIAEYLQSTQGVTAAAARSAAPVLRDQTGGNPFFLRELWRDLQSRGGLVGLRSEGLRAPGSIVDTLERRLTGMPISHRAVIEAAAVLGDTFDVPTLSATSTSDTTTVLTALDGAAAIGLVEQTTDASGTYSFLHALSRQAVLDRLSPSSLADLHARAASALESQGAEPQVIPRLAHHYLRCHVLGYDREAVHFCAEAARLAQRGLASEEAAAWFERAAGIPGSDASTRATLLLAAAENHVRSGGYAQARAMYEQLSASSDPEIRLEAAIGHEDASWRPGHPGSRSTDMLTEALASTTLTVDDPRHIKALAVLGRALVFAGESGRARKVAARATELAHMLDDDDLVTDVEVTSLWAVPMPDQVAEKCALATDLIERLRASGDHERRAQASFFKAQWSYILGHRQDLDAALAEAAEAGVAAGNDPLVTYVTGCVKQGRAFQRGDFIGARDLAEELDQLSQAFGEDDTEGSYGLRMYMIQRETGRLDSVRSLITGEEPIRGRWAPGLMALYTELGMVAAARRVLRSVLEALTDDRNSGAQWSTELAFATEAALEVGDDDALAILWPHLQRLSGQNLVGGEFVATFGAADRYLARLASVTGEADRAEELFTSALSLDQATGSVVHTAETLVHYGRHLLTNGDEPGGWAKLTRARELAEPIGQQRVLRLIPLVGQERALDGLSEREIAVLRLLAEGLSNREIGERLYISANTAANHVRSILMKTGTANRTQAAMYASDHRLV